MNTFNQSTIAALILANNYPMYVLFYVVCEHDCVVVYL